VFGVGGFDDVPMADYIVTITFKLTTASAWTQNIEFHNGLAGGNALGVFLQILQQPLPL